MGGAAVVIDAWAARGVGGVEGATWGVAKVGEAGDEGAVQVLAVGSPASVRGRFDRLGSWSDRQPLFQARLNRPYARSNRHLRLAVESLAEHGVSAVV
jgi:hypothetical protein